MAIKTSHLTLTLRGASVEKGISVSDGKIPFEPCWGMTRHSSGLLASSSVPDGDLDKVHVAITEAGVVLVLCEEVSQRELVLVQEYSPGSGGKRWPGFRVEFGPEVRKLSEACTSGGSGGETWVLVSAPLGWAENIAGQFVNERDYGGQTISYKPDFNPREQELERELGELRSELENLGYAFEQARVEGSDYVELSFTKGEYKGETQWQYTAHENGKTVKYVVDRYGDWPGSEAETWVCYKERTLVDKPRFQLIVVGLVTSQAERGELLAKIGEIEAELAGLRSEPEWLDAGDLAECQAQAYGEDSLPRAWQIW